MKVELVSENKKVTARAKDMVSVPDIDGKAELTEYDVDGWKYVLLRVTPADRAIAAAQGWPAAKLNRPNLLKFKAALPVGRIAGTRNKRLKNSLGIFINA